LNADRIQGDGMKIIGLAAMAVGLALSGGAKAAIVDAQPTGFQVEQKVQIAAPASKVWAALGEYGSWWNGAHSWSQDARNLHLDLKVGGCLCETLPDGGGVRHMTVVMVMPNKRVILEGTLGPLVFSGAAGHLVWELSEKDGVTTLTQDYYVGGYFPGGLDKIAPAVDGVLTQAAGRLKAYVETGKPG
jgi:uncharacterized protein YndB with AHSA1/START domain